MTLYQAYKSRKEKEAEVLDTVLIDKLTRLTRFIIE
jgi:hypothetical protein